MQEETISTWPRVMAMTLCCQLRADAKIRSAAQKKSDGRILSLVSRDPVAAEGRYHTSCYKMYTKEEDSKEDVADTEETDDVHAQYDAAVKESCQELFMFIRTHIFGNPCVVTMTSLTARLVSSMRSQGLTEVKESTTKHIRQKLQSEFAGALHIIADEKGKIHIYPDNLSMIKLAEENQSLKRELQTLKCARAHNAIASTAKKLRKDITCLDVPQAWPPEVKSEEECPVIPESLRLFLSHLFTGSNDPDCSSQRVQRLLQSFGHDIVYAVACGKIKPAKHIILAFSVKSLTGNVELMNILN